MTDSIKIPKVRVQKGYILSRLLLAGRLENKKLFHDIHTCASGSRISELRSDGWLIDDNYIYERTQEGKEVRVKMYYIKRNNIMKYLEDENVRIFLERAKNKYK